MMKEQQASFAIGLIDGFREHEISLEDQIAILRIAIAFAKTIAEDEADHHADFGGHSNA